MSANALPATPPVMYAIDRLARTKTVAWPSSVNVFSTKPKYRRNPSQRWVTL
jgi:hypothetical protein